MPLMKYFGFVGSALVLLLLGLNWFLPQAVSEPIGADIDRPVIRISSDEKLPDRAIIDTSLPTIVPSPATSQFAERSPEVEVAGPTEVQGSDAKRLTGAANLITTDGAPKTPTPTKRRPSKKSVTLRLAQSPNHHVSSSYPKQVAAPVTRMSLLDVIKDRFGRGFFKLN
jgi:hypothetical protein